MLALWMVECEGRALTGGMGHRGPAVVKGY